MFAFGSPHRNLKKEKMEQFYGLVAIVADSNFHRIRLPVAFPNRILSFSTLLGEWRE